MTLWMLSDRGATADRRYSIDCINLKALGSAPAHGFEEALAATVAWYREHESWCRKVRSGGTNATLLNSERRPEQRRNPCPVG
jgi:dTDP-D-glucose 4,6-dehydratase